jgi:hypothetical protein
VRRRKLKGLRPGEVFVVPYGETRKPPDNYTPFTVWIGPHWPLSRNGIPRDQIPPMSPAGQGDNRLYPGNYFLYRRDA